MALTLVFFLILCCDGVYGGDSPDPHRSFTLQVPADRAPAWSGSDLVLVASDGTYQVLEGDRVGPVRYLPAALGAVPPLDGENGAWVLDAEGTLWRISRMAAEPAERRLHGVLGMAPGEPSPALLTADGFRLPGGLKVPIPFEGRGVTALDGEGFWIFGEGRAVLLDSEGNIRWSWDPEDLHPGQARLGVERLFAITSEGCLVALDRETGRERYRFPTGASIVSPPEADGDGVVFASRDHIVRALDPGAGRVLWQTRLRGRPDFGPYRVGDAYLFAEAAGDRLVLLTLEEGKVVWSWKVPEGAILVPPALRGSDVALLAWGEGAAPVLHLITIAPRGGGEGPDEPDPK